MTGVDHSAHACTILAQGMLVANGELEEPARLWQAELSTKCPGCQHEAGPDKVRHAAKAELSTGETCGQ
eukprot:CAMPEP_0171095250 /NCGR_PEP_ID=MMETSP0766_2-20121228/43072_1 /TAXON_ID=439317 /ORGANISM="Gambierdiscus australes, Strain CAWD 149" /LENGTH=68 /DNA_ID=CAMNT_0011554039 /DNA_START=72 /DNA_END=275 /DNA_ORIENTATION=+